MSSVLSAGVGVRPTGAEPAHDDQPRSSRDVLVVVALAFAAIAVVGLIDNYSPENLSLSAFYLLPIVGATVGGGRRAGFAAAAASVLAALVANDLLGAHAPATAIF